MDKLLLPLRGPLLALATLLALVTLHEAGHVLAGWATGGHVVEFDILSVRPHVRIAGVTSATDNAVRAIAGSGLVLVGWVALILSIPRRRALYPVRATATFFAGIELLGWFLSAVLHNYQPQRNDAGKFLNWTSTDPWLAALFCVALALCGATVIFATRHTPSPAAVRARTDA